MKITSFTLAGPGTEPIIGAALDSIAPIVDRRLIIWTGPSDAETMARAWLLGCVGPRTDVACWHWRNDYGAARNAGLDLAAKEDADWSCMVDTDERVICPDPAAFRAWLTALPPDVQVVLVHHNDGSHTRERFFRTSTRYRFQGRTHEAFVIPQNFQAIAPRNLIQWSELPKSEEQIAAKFARDVEMLRADIAERPDFAPPYYYLGYTLQLMGKLDEAVEAYRTHHRLDSLEGGAWSCFRAAECYLRLNQPNRAIDCALAGLARDAGVGELYWIAAVASLQEGRTEQARCWAECARLHGMGSEAERRRVGFRAMHGLTAGPGEILAAVAAAKENPSAPVERVRAIVFSKDRPMQLDACLRSMRLHCADPDAMAVHVLYKATTPEYARAYGEIAAAYPWARLHEERAFEAQTRGLLGGCEYVLFVVDDTVFVRGFSVERVAEHLDAVTVIGYSLRLGNNCARCYPTSKAQGIPRRWPFGLVAAHRWANADGDWGYPLEVSSSFYRSDVIRAALDGRTFTNPNTLEAQLHAASAAIDDRYVLLAPHTSIAFSVPANKVQDTYANRAGADPALAPSALLSRWQAGDRIDVSALAGYTPSACHEEVAYTFTNERPRVEVISRPIHITVTSAARNAEKWAAKCVESVRRQSFGAWHHIYIDDASDDRTFAAAFDAGINDERCRAELNDEHRRGVLANMLDVWRSLPPDEVVVWLDGDDWLATDRALQVVADAHANGALMTYGQFQWASTGARGFAAPCGPDPRAEPWRATHLRTFRAGLVQRIRDEDLRWDFDGKGLVYFDQAAEDQSVMLPCLEMAGQDRAVFIPDVLCVYNDANASSMSDAARVREHAGVRVIRSRPRYERIGGL